MSGRVILNHLRLYRGNNDIVIVLVSVNCNILLHIKKYCFIAESRNIFWQENCFLRGCFELITHYVLYTLDVIGKGLICLSI